MFEHFAGAALGTFIGDALGMPVEGWSPGMIQNQYGLLDDLKPGRFAAGCYTDDTEMMISLLEALVEAQGFDPAITAARFLANFHPIRGYGGRIYDLMDRLAAGVPWDQVSTHSFGNGGAMRVAPVGFFFYDDLNKLTQAAAGQAKITHTHPEGVAGAVIQAGAVALALRAGLKGIRPQKTSYLKKLANLGRPYDRTSADRLLDLADINPGPIPDLIPQIRTKFRCNVKAIEAVPPAIAALLYTDNFKDAVTLGVNLGGDTDTIGAMAGAIAGAWSGLSNLPIPWLDRLENGTLGRDHIINLCRQAARLKVRG